MSWIIVRKSDRKAVLELFDAELVEKINRERYEAVPAMQYLQELNAALALANQQA